MVDRRKYALTTDSYTKAASDARYASGGVVGLSYTKPESDAKYALFGVAYTKAESDARYAMTTDGYTKAAADARFAPIGLSGTSYTKAESDLKYPLIGDVYTKTAADARYAPAGSYALVGASYTMAASDAKYALTTDAYTKSASDARYTLIGVAYTKAESDAQNVIVSTALGNVYTKSQSDARFAPISVVGASYSMAASDARYEPIDTMYTKAESNALYAPIGLRASGTIVVSTPHTFTQTWNAAGVAFTAFLINVTNTASAAASLLADWQVGGVSKFSVDKTGTTTLAGALQFSAVRQIVSGPGALTFVLNDLDNDYNGVTFDGPNYSVNFLYMNLYLGGGGHISGVSNIGMTGLLSGGYGIDIGAGNVGQGTVRIKTTWASSGIQYFGIKMDITNTASAFDSRLIDLQVGGVSKFYVRSNGDTLVAGTLTTGAPAGGTAGAWKFGIRVAATVALSTSQYIQLDIGGTLYKLGIVA